MATPAEESKVGKKKKKNSLLYFTGLIGGERVNLLVDAGTLHCFTAINIV